MLENKLASLGSERDGLVARIQSALEAAEFGDRHLNEPTARAMAAQGWALIREMEALAQ